MLVTSHKFEKVHRVIKFNQNFWIKPYIDMNTDINKKAKIDFEKYFFKFMNHAVFVKTTEHLRKQRYQTCHNRKKKKLFGVRTKLSYYKVFHRKFISNGNEKNRNTCE